MTPFRKCIPFNFGNHKKYIDQICLKKKHIKRECYILSNPQLLTLRLHPHPSHVSLTADHAPITLHPSEE